MAFPTSSVFGLGVPIALLAVNLIWGYGGILGTIGLFIWIGLAVILMPTEEPA